MAEDKKPAETPETSTPAVETKQSETVAVPPKTKNSNNKTLIIVLVVVGFFVLLPGLIFGAAMLWFGSGNNAEKTAEKLVESATGGNVDIDSSDNSYTIKGDDGSELSVGGSDQDYADDFPSEVPKYPGGDVQSNFRSKSDSGTYWSNSVTTKDSSTKVVDYFKDKFSSWSDEGEYSYNDSTSLSYKKDKLSVLITVTKDDSTTNITYTVTED